MSWAFYETHSHLLSQRAILNPSFAWGSFHVGGADSDLIVGRCLIDIKTAVNPGKLAKPYWPYQLLGYALLDWDNHYRISELGVYLPRQTALVRWSLPEYRALLGASTRLSMVAARAAFREAVE